MLDWKKRTIWCLNPHSWFGPQRFALFQSFHCGAKSAGLQAFVHHVMSVLHGRSKLEGGEVDDRLVNVGRRVKESLGKCGRLRVP